MNKPKVNVSDNNAVFEYINNLTDVDSILENSLLIYGSDIPTKKDILENILRYDDNLSMEQLSIEHEKIKSLIEHAVTHNIPVSESTQRYLVDMCSLVGNRMVICEDIQNNVSKLMLNMYDIDLRDTNFEKSDTRLRNLAENYLVESVDILKSIYSADTITATGILESCNALFSGAFGNDVEKYNILKNSLFNKIKTTLKCEMNEDDSYDLPVMQCLGHVKNELKTTFYDKSDVLAGIDSMFDELYSELDETLTNFRIKISCEDGMNPNPFDVYNLTPFPVGVRTVTNAIMNVATAETDEDIKESLMNFARLEKVCETFDQNILLEKRGFVGKKAREISRMSKKEIGGKLNKVTKGTNDIKTAAKKTVDPMAKFVENTFSKMKSADTEERRNLIIKGNIVPKITRWIRRGLVIGAIGGLMNPIIAGISLLTYIATDKHFDRKEKAKILRELKSELEIVEEKIEDSRGDDKKQNKYELMRIRTKLRKDIERIELGVKYN